MKTLALIILVIAFWCITTYGQGFNPNPKGQTEIQNVEFFGQKVIRWEVWGKKGEGSVLGVKVPDGEVWKVRAAGIITNDGTAFEYMMQIYSFWAEHTGGPNPQLLAPLSRNVGTAGGTPTLAIDPEMTILLPGETLAARVNGMRADRQMGIRCTAWVFTPDQLPKLLNIK